VNGRRLREMMQRGLVEAPGCADPFEAMLIERAGFDAVYLSGFALSASLLGEPDLGLIGLAEVTGATRRIVAAVDLPVIVDIDTGFGGPLNIRRTVVEVEAAGASAVQIEDQVAPKRCGHFEDKTVVEADEAVERVRIAVESRQLPDTVVIARTAALAVRGLEEAIDRGRAFSAAGADAVFVEAIETVAQLAAIAAALQSTPLVYNAVEGGRSPMLERDELSRAGVRVLIHPVTLLLEKVRAQRAALAALRAGEPATPDTITTVRELLAADQAMAFHAAPGSVRRPASTPASRDEPNPRTPR
jgi:2-methylisocitrate lyase-like PEP mutase family enzyme